MKPGHSSLVVQRLGYLTPAQARQQLLALGAAA
jgi:hypothetical protein